MIDAAPGPGPCGAAVLKSLWHCGIGLGNRDSASEPLCRLGISRSDHGPGVGTALLGNVKFESESHCQYSEFTEWPPGRLRLASGAVPGRRIRVSLILKFFY